jgi:hypothetical protein
LGFGCGAALVDCFRVGVFWRDGFVSPVGVGCSFISVDGCSFISAVGWSILDSVIGSVGYSFSLESSIGFSSGVGKCFGFPQFLQFSEESKPKCFSLNSSSSAFISFGFN